MYTHTYTQTYTLKKGKNSKVIFPPYDFIIFVAQLNFTEA